MTHPFLLPEKKIGGKKITHPCERVLLHDITHGRNIHGNVSCKSQGHSSAVSCTQRSMASWGVELADAELQAHPIYGTQMDTEITEGLIWYVNIPEKKSNFFGF